MVVTNVMIVVALIDLSSTCTRGGVDRRMVSIGHFGGLVTIGAVVGGRLRTMKVEVLRRVGIVKDLAGLITWHRARYCGRGLVTFDDRRGSGTIESISSGF